MESLKDILELKCLQISYINSIIEELILEALEQKWYTKFDKRLHVDFTIEKVLEKCNSYQIGITNDNLLKAIKGCNFISFIKGVFLITLE
mmetsp:Transcript_28071/g.38972  ORF Transcript_28071/g.38972 Transcript_28071/m.38972 type:complete len:90 (+) Transcript_28071:1733-2002(+)